MTLFHALIGSDMCLILLTLGQMCDTRWKCSPELMEELLAPPVVDQLESACQAREKFAVSLYDKSSIASKSLNLRKRRA